MGGNTAGGWLEFVALMALVQVAALPCFLAGRLAFALQAGWLVAVHTATTNLLTLLLTLAATIQPFGADADTMPPTTPFPPT